MGCDIHAYIEYYERGVLDYSAGSIHSGELHLGRNYTLFNIMAGVRGLGPPLYQPRDMPTIPPLSYGVMDAYTLRIDDTYSSTMRLGHGPISGCISREEADLMISKGTEYFDTEKTRVIRFGHHTASWLTKSELIEVRRNYLLDALDFEHSEYKGKKRDKAKETIQNSSQAELMRSAFPSIECPVLNATIASMIAVENSGNWDTRLVFWFDS